MSLSQDRDNNFNLLRAVAAMLVIVTHAFSVTGSGADPMISIFGTSMGSWAVDVFFVASGYLIAKSWDRRRSPITFLWARFLRIYPALWVNVTVTVIVVAIWFTDLSLTQFLTHLSTWKYLLENSTLLPVGVYTTLPGAFASPGQEGLVNLPLWTLPYELKMYLATLAIGWVGLLHRKAFLWALAGVLGLLYAQSIFTSAGEQAGAYQRLGFFFASGAVLYMHRDSIPLLRSVALVLVAVLLCSLLLPSVNLRLLLLGLATPYLVIFAALVPSGVIRRYNRLGDYSYGLYIYGFPVQQMLVVLAGGAMSVFSNAVSALAIAGACAALSWHLLESRALRIKLPEGLRTGFLGKPGIREG